jgi:hypothetical protein
MMAEMEGFSTDNAVNSKNTEKYGIPEKASKGLRPPAVYHRIDRFGRQPRAISCNLETPQV